MLLATDKDLILYSLIEFTVSSYFVEVDKVLFPFNGRFVKSSLIASLQVLRNCTENWILLLVNSFWLIFWKRLFRSYYKDKVFCDRLNADRMSISVVTIPRSSSGDLVLKSTRWSFRGVDWDSRLVHNAKRIRWSVIIG